MSEAQALHQARELLETLNEWFAQREAGEPTTNSEEVMFAQVHHRLTLLDAAIQQQPPEWGRVGAFTSRLGMIE